MAIRIVSVQSGEVLNSVTVSKTIYSVGLNANLYRFVAIDKLAQAEAGFTRNEPTQLAVRQAIDLAVYATVMEGTRKHLWSFADPAAGEKLVVDYLARDKVEPPSTLSLPPAVPVSVQATAKP